MRHRETVRFSACEGVRPLSELAAYAAIGAGAKGYDSPYKEATHACDLVMVREEASLEWGFKMCFPQRDGSSCEGQAKEETGVRGETLQPPSALSQGGLPSTNIIARVAKYEQDGNILGITASFTADYVPPAEDMHWLVDWALKKYIAHVEPPRQFNKTFVNYKTRVSLHLQKGKGVDLIDSHSGWALAPVCVVAEDGAKMEYAAAETALLDNICTDLSLWGEKAYRALTIGQLKRSEIETSNLNTHNIRIRHSL